MTKETDMDIMLSKVESMKDSMMGSSNQHFEATLNENFGKDQTIGTEEIESQPRSVGFCGKPVSLIDVEIEEDDGKILTFGQGFDPSYKAEMTGKKPQRRSTHKSVSHDGGLKASSKKAC